MTKLLKGDAEDIGSIFVLGDLAQFNELDWIIIFLTIRQCLLLVRRPAENVTHECRCEKMREIYFEIKK